MTPYILIIFINWQVAAIEFAEPSACFVVQESVREQIKDVKNANASCFKKFGGVEKQT